jgi:hypothetical protein
MLPESESKVNVSPIGKAHAPLRGKSLAAARYAAVGVTSTFYSDNKDLYSFLGFRSGWFSGYFEDELSRFPFIGE